MTPGTMIFWLRVSQWYLCVVDQLLIRGAEPRPQRAFAVMWSATRRCDRMCSARSPVSSGSSQIASGPHHPHRVRPRGPAS